jgi:hypothetical protein
MTPKTALLLLMALTALDGCATAPATSTTASTTPRRRRRPVTQPGAEGTGAPSLAAAASQPVPSSSLALTPATARADDRRGDGGAMEARTASRSIGTPVVRSRDDVGELHAQWAALDGRARVRCDGTAPALVPSTQSPYEPGNAAIVRSFLPVERRVIACLPPTNARGRLPTRGMFSSSGAPTEFTFPGVTLTREQATCVGEALCAVRMPAFRAPVAPVDYEVLVYVAATP